ncbi:MAG: ribosome silencing factor [Legionellales bacterium]|nr:ribosome silencing factor [Legionellales bacterium]OUX67491.1 MAG: ribosome silencing factor [bacterium TMED178]|tara:strand:+ start:5576 stop:5914 length:339 start_codon:yes stop_codon:yes gene_type:complete
MTNLKQDVSKEILANIIDILESQQAINLSTIPVAKITSITDYMVICEGRSIRHIQTLAEELIKSTRVKVYNKNQIEYTNDLWVVVDCGEVIVHIMHQDSRAHYQLEKLWEPM